MIHVMRDTSSDHLFFLFQERYSGSSGSYLLRRVCEDEVLMRDDELLKKNEEPLPSVERKMKSPNFECCIKINNPQQQNT